MTLAEILASKDLADDAEFSIGDTKLKVRDLRAFNEVAAKSDEAAKARMSEAERMRRQAEELAQQAATLLAQLQETPAPEDQNKAKAFDWESDPILSPLKPILRPLIDGASAYEKKVAELGAALKQIQGIYALRELQRQWDGYQAQLKGKNVTFEQAVQETLRRKSVDNFGIPTLEPFVQELTAPDREAAARADERAKADAEWQKKLDAQKKASSMPKPAGASIHTAEKRGAQPPIKRIEELTSEVVANDDEIAKLVSGAVQ